MSVPGLGPSPFRNMPSPTPRGVNRWFLLSVYPRLLSTFPRRRYGRLTLFSILQRLIWSSLSLWPAVLHLRSRSLEPVARATKLDLLLDPRTDDWDQGTCTPLVRRLYRRAIRITDEIHGGEFTSKRRERFFCRELFPQELLQPIQRTVRERWGNNSTLWSPILRFVKDVFFHIPHNGLQPLLENDSVHGDVSQKPIV